MWPFVLFLILRNAFYQQFENFAAGWSAYMEYPAWGLWVLWLLAWINLAIDLGLLVSYFLPKLQKIIAPAILIIAFAVLVCLRENEVIPSYHFLGYDYFVIYTPIFIIGYLIGDKLFSLYNKISSIVLMILGLVATFLITLFVKPFLGNGYHIENNLYIYYLASLTAICFYYGISTLLERIKIGRFIGFLGQFTLEIYFLHLVLLKNWGGLKFDNTFIAVMASIGLFLLCLVNTAAVVTALYFIPFAHFLMFGRHYSFYKFEDRLFSKIKKIFVREKQEKIKETATA
jgi:hypothetical protein